MGVLGEDESWTDSGESSTVLIGSDGRSVWPETERFVCDFLPDRAYRSLATVLSSSGMPFESLIAGDCTKVAWLDVLDLEDSFDRSSVLEVGLELVDMRDRGLSSSFPRSKELAAPRFFSSRLVSGGLGGRRSVLREEVVFFVDPKSADLDRFSSSTPMSVASGVGGPVPVRGAAAEVVERSSLLNVLTASLLCALLKLG